LGTVILIDSNILIDIIEADPDWRSWSLDQIAELSFGQTLVVNEIVVAEVAPAMGSLAAFYGELESLDIVLKSLNDEAAFEAGMAFQTYRQRRDRSAPKSILPDFLIGGHARSMEASILTRDPRFYRAYFPEVLLISPTKEEK
jgi:predicted nucleic acid-binding protein